MIKEIDFGNGLQAPSRRDGKCITVCKRSAAYGKDRYYYTKSRRDEIMSSLRDLCLRDALLSVSCATLAYGYAHLVPAGLRFASAEREMQKSGVRVFSTERAIPDGMGFQHALLTFNIQHSKEYRFFN